MRQPVYFSTYPFAFDVIGGGEMQLLAHIREMGERGIDARPFDPWRPELGQCGIFHYFSAMPGSLPLCRYVRQKGIPLFVSPNLWLSEDNVDIYRLGEIRELLALADRIVCNSNMEKKRFARILELPEEKIAVVHCGVDDIFMREASPEEWREKFGSGKFVLNVGTIEPRKNQLGLIRAMRNFPEYRLVLVGNVRDEVYASRCRREGGDQLQMSGHMDHADPLFRSMIAACDLFVGPGFNETPGVANLEAGCLGASLAITENGSTREYFGDYVEYLNPASDMLIASAIARALQRGADQKLVPHLKGMCAWDGIVAKLANEYEKALAKNGHVHAV